MKIIDILEFIETLEEYYELISFLSNPPFYLYNQQIVYTLTEQKQKIINKITSIFDFGKINNYISLSKLSNRIINGFENTSFTLKINFEEIEKEYKIDQVFIENYDYFKNIIKNSDEKSSNIFTYHEKNGEDLITFLITGTINIDLSKIKEIDISRYENLSIIADMLLLNGLRDICKYIIELYNL